MKRVPLTGNIFINPLDEGESCVSTFYQYNNIYKYYVIVRHLPKITLQ